MFNERENLKDNLPTFIEDKNLEPVYYVVLY